ncbi:MAG: DUF87 domain-containing protein [Caldilineaceae bacterium]|nr:DUF87 domain-containing protein [Caldilineaceae bacterium]
MDKFWLYFFGFLIVLVVLLGVFRPDQLDNALNWLGLFAMVFLWTVAGLIVLALAIGAGLLIHKAQHKSRRQVDGSYALQRVRLGHGRVAVVDPNAMTSFGYVIDKRTGQITELEPAAGWQIQATIRALVEKTRQAQAIYPGDYTRTDKYGAFAKAPSVTAGAMRIIGQQDKPPKIIDAPDGWDEPTPPPVNLLPGPVDALRTGDKGHWTVGQADDGALCQFDPAVHAHAAVVGNTGTGKTTSVAALLAAQAVRHGYHTIILDPDGGADWQPFAAVAEHHETDRSAFADQVRTVYGLFERRADGANKRPVFVVLEEYGDLINQLRMVSRRDADHVDAMLDTILRRGRKRNIHLCFVDQYPEHWTPQVISGAKFQAVFQLGPNQGAKMQQYKAHELPDRGAFLHRGRIYHTWHAAADLPRLLTGVQPTARRLIVDSTATPVDDTPTPVTSEFPKSPRATHAQRPPEPPAEAEAKWREFTDRWFEAHPQFLSEPYGGISALARAMAHADGRPDDGSNYKSVAKTYFDAFTADWTKALNQTTKE